MDPDTDNEAAPRSPSPDDSDNPDSADMAESQSEHIKTEDGASKDGNGKSKSANAKDPSRPRRKKARRACFACQRAHLTCGDERPCQRCIKRGLADACADGVRKKAKYLHDAPNEALMPGAANLYTYSGLPRTQPIQGAGSPTVNDLYAQQPGLSSQYPVYSSPPQAGQMPTSMVDTVMGGQAFANQHSPLASQFSSDVAAQASSIQNLVDAMRQAGPVEGTEQASDPFGANIAFDQNDVSQFNFDPASFNFGNHYGALEFGMLGQLSSGAPVSPPSDQSSTGTFATPGTMPANMSNAQYLFHQDPDLKGWQPAPQSNLRSQNSNESFNVSAPPAFTVGGGGSQFASPTSEGNQPILSGGLDDGGSSLFQATMAPPAQALQGPTSQPGINIAPIGAFGQPRRMRDPSVIYEKINQPYPYTDGFHSLIAFLQKRFSSQKTLRIAKALASIRPSFISGNSMLTRDDLVFMEKCFQRTLWQMEEFINSMGTPTLVCRRTGEVAAVGKEFSILTGWKKDILLGREPNLNVNTGGASGNPGTGASSRGGMNTPRLSDAAKNIPIDPNRPQAVFLAELLDADSVVEFYEDFARLAFTDSRGVSSTRCKLLKYKTKEIIFDESGGMSDLGSEQRIRARARGEAGIDELGDEQGKIDCCCCWTVRRDIFDLPMMIVMNFLPCIS